jgi:beta-lactamase regulating signal transducer with metallopeptidase domain
MDTVLNWLWQGCVVAAASFAMLCVLERARANVRYIVSWAALLLVVVLPVLPSLPSAPISAAPMVATRSDAVLSLPDAWWTSTKVMLAAWALWSTVCVVRLARAITALRRARTRSHSFPSSLESVLPHWNRVCLAGRRAALVLSDSVPAASVLGSGPPMIAVAPSLAETLDAGELDRVLIHEWAHVQRRDDLAHIVQILIHIVAGWHPAVWWLDRRLHVEREVACDEITIAITASPKSYAECLLKLADLKRPGRAMAAAPAVLTTFTLRARITKIVSPQRWMPPVWSHAIAATTISTLCLMSVALGELKLVEATVFALPFEATSTRIATSALDAIAPIAMPRPSQTAEKKRRPRRRTPAALATQRPDAKEPSSTPTPAPQSESAAPSTPATDNAAQPATSHVTESDHRAATSEAPTVVAAPKQQPHAAAPEQPSTSRWSAAADGGTAMGRKSKQAGVATAAFFKRVARGVAGSF